MMPFIPQSQRIINRGIPEKFDLPGATKYGGFSLLSDFVRKVGVDRELEKGFGLAKAFWAEYSLSSVLRHLLDGFLLGLERVSDFVDLEREPLLCEKRRREKLPDYTLLYKDLERFSTEAEVAGLKGIGRRLVRKALRGQRSGVLEVDSTVMPVYGEDLEGAEVGYNPKKPGRPSYHPLFCRDRKSRLVLSSHLRPGKAGSATGIIDFLRDVLTLLPRQGKGWLLRGDAGFGGEEVFTFLEQRRVGYVTKLRMMEDLADWVFRGGSFRPARLERDEEEVEVKSEYFQRKSWRWPRRVVVIRKRNPEHKQSWLWDKYSWNYCCYVTDRRWAEEDILRFYEARGDMENCIQELKEDVSIGKVSSQHFQAQAALLEIKSLAYNLLILFQNKILRLGRWIRIKTLRRRYVEIPGKLSNHGNQFTLRLSEIWPWKNEWGDFRRRLALCA